ncbi:MAG: nuclear transport factor 2 family protein [Chloroflexi bacterium]|nr:nuclear transport factor 2 family protein [Chloroflexota bacterium]
MATNDERRAIEHVIETAYIKGIHGNQDETTVKSGFHPDFAMLVLRDNAIEKVTVDDWLTRLEGMKAENPALWTAETRHTFELVDVTAYSAVAKLEVFKGDTYFSTDYMLLYRFENGWQIVSKIYST